MSTKQPSDSVRFYDENAKDFKERTFDLKMVALYEPFLSRLREGARILDAGCGPGRDLSAFARMGYKITGMDASKEMVRLAREASGEEVLHLSFQDINWDGEFDGVWACASLLHVPEAELPEVFRRISRALRLGGLLYCSFKYGQGERVRGERTFTDMDEVSLERLVGQVPNLELMEWWRTEDVRADHQREYWLNAIIGKVS